MNMKIGIISDTHGNSKLMIRVCDSLIEEFGVSEIYHLGDSFEDFQYLKEIGYPILGIPGLWDDEFRDNTTPKVLIRNFVGKKFIFAHAEFLIRRIEGKDFDVWCYGHTHEPKIDIEENRIHFNPGHLKKSVDRGYPASFGIVIFNDNTIKFRIFDIDNALLQSLDYSLNIKNS